MSFFRYANTAETKKIMRDFAKDLASFTVELEGTDELRGVVCAVCDSMSKEANDWESVDLESFICFAKRCSLSKRALASKYSGYPQELVDYYTASGFPSLNEFVLSPRSLVDDVNDTIIVCKECCDHLEKHTKRNSNPPKNSIINGYLIGSAPSLLSELNEVELAIVSQVRITCQSWIFFGGCHRHIQGWHTLYKTKPAESITTLNQVAGCELKGQLVVVLTGPFTSTQVAMTKEKTMVNRQKVVAAFEWLQKNNFHYKDIVLPQEDEIPTPIIIEENL